MVGDQGVTPTPEQGDTGGVTDDPMVNELAGDGFDPAYDNQPDGSDPSDNQPPDLSDLDPDTADAAQLIERMQLTNEFAARTADNLNEARQLIERLQQENSQLRGGDVPPDGDGDERVTYAPEQLGDDVDFYDEEAMIAFMSQHDPNFEQMKGDDVYMGQNRAYFGALMNALGKMGMENAAMQRQMKMQQYGVTQNEIEGFLNIPEFSHLNGMPIDHIIDVMRGIQKLSGGQNPSKPEGGVTPTPPGGARQAVRRDPRHYQEGRRSVGTGNLSPEDQIHKALDAGDVKAGRDLAREMFYSFGGDKKWG